MGAGAALIPAGQLRAQLRDLCFCCFTAGTFVRRALVSCFALARQFREPTDHRRRQTALPLLL
ncbi:hypothetical protein DF057_28715 [Burkholderia cepacia]|nr:hypothetical protein DF057_28715 [Burkholderia cepacia]